MNKLILFKHPVSYAKLKDALEDVIENFIDSSDLDYKNQAYWLKYFHRILMGKTATYRDKVNDSDNQMYVQCTFDTGFYGKICLYDGVQTKGPVTLTDETMINGICVVAPKNFFGRYNKSLYKILIKMGNFIKNSVETDDSLICYSVDGDIELLVFLGAFSYLKKLTACHSEGASRPKNPFTLCFPGFFANAQNDEKTKKTGHFWSAFF